MPWSCQFLWLSLLGQPMLKPHNNLFHFHIPSPVPKARSFAYLSILSSEILEKSTANLENIALILLLKAVLPNHWHVTMILDFWCNQNLVGLWIWVNKYWPIFIRFMSDRCLKGIKRKEKTSKQVESYLEAFYAKWTWKSTAIKLFSHFYWHLLQ